MTVCIGGCTHTLQSVKYLKPLTLLALPGSPARNGILVLTRRISDTLTNKQTRQTVPCIALMIRTLNPFIKRHKFNVAEALEIIDYDNNDCTVSFLSV